MKINDAFVAVGRTAKVSLFGRFANSLFKITITYVTCVFTELYRSDEKRLMRLPIQST